MWNFDESRKRVKKQYDDLRHTKINVQRLTREMDLSNLSPTDARIVHGAHLYVDVVNLRHLVASSVLRRENFKPLHRYMHVLRIEQRRIMQQVFEGDKIQVQGAKFHGLLYKPYDDDASLAWHSVLIGIALSKTISEALPQVFPDYPAMTPTVGIDLGNTIVANVGVRGDRELISIGSAANRAAHLLIGSNALHVSSDLWSALAGEQQDLFVETDDGYKLDLLSLGDASEAIEDEGFSWSVEDSVACMQETVDSIPLSEIQSHEIETLLDLSSLGPKHFATCMAVNMFVDIDGYTSLIDSLMEDEEKLTEAIKMLHLFRYELQQVTQSDFNGVSIQHQGDRLQAIVHLPYEDDDRIKEKGGEMCVSYNSSVEQVLNRHFPIFDEKYHVSIGAAFGKTIVVRSGTRGDLDASCFGDAVLDGESLQLWSAGNEMRISKDVFAAIENETLRGFFAFEDDNNCYVAKQLTWERAEDAENAKSYAAKAPAFFIPSSHHVEFGNTHGTEQRPSNAVSLKNTRNWSN